MSLDLFQLIERSLKVSEISNGAFDISFASIGKFWVFDGREVTQIDSAMVKNSVALIDYRNIVLNYGNHSVFLKEPGMKIGFGAIGKGYAADEAKKLMTNLGVDNGVVNAGGDLIAWGKNN